MGFQSSMTLCSGSALFVTVLVASLASHSLAIRVDWNTNHGPIVPPTSTPAPVPQPPFREPAPVWEDLSNDIVNPNPYKYVAPPPSRPRYNPDYQQQRQPSIHPTVISPSPTTFGSASATAALATVPTTSTTFYSAPASSQSPSTSSSSSSTTSTTSTVRPVPSYGTIITRPLAGQSQSVSSLAVKFVPNVGKQYVAVVPAGQTNDYSAPKAQYLAGNVVYDKYNGKYNAKLKKYKAYEQKAKVVPYVLYYMPKQQYFYYNNLASKSAPHTKLQWTANQI